MDKKYLLVGADGKSYLSSRPGVLGGHRKQRLYGRLDCSSALRALARAAAGKTQHGYDKERVFFASELDAISAGYRPCSRCLPSAYAQWRSDSTPTG